MFGRCGVIQWNANANFRSNNAHDLAFIDIGEWKFNKFIVSILHIRVIYLAYLLNETICDFLRYWGTRTQQNCLVIWGAINVWHHFSTLTIYMNRIWDYMRWNRFTKILQIHCQRVNCIGEFNGIRIGKFFLFISKFCSILNRLNVYNGQIDSLRNVTNDNAHMAIMSISQVVDYFNFLHFPNVQVLKTKQYIQAMPFCMYFRKHSFLERPFNQQLNLYSPSGLIVQWAKNFRKQAFNSDRIEPQPLLLDQFTGVLAVCICLSAASVVVFILELMSNCHDTIKKIMDFFTYKASPVSIPISIPRYKFTFFQRSDHRKQQTLSDVA